jgi:hypothetical protein
MYGNYKIDNKNYGLVQIYGYKLVSNGDGTVRIEPIHKNQDNKR